MPKISNLDEKLNIDQGDYIPIVDKSGFPTTKKVTYSTLSAMTQYAWKGEWLTGTVYVVNNCVQKDGSAYVCIVAHTSGTFATDLAANKWSLLVQGRSTTAPSVTGSRGGNAALASLLTILDGLNIITDDSEA